MTARTTPLGDEVHFTHDLLGRVSRKTAGETETHYSYNDAGALIRAASPTCTLEHEYDVMGRLLAESTDGRTTRYTYDVLGRRTSRTTPTGAVTELDYDEAGNRTRLDTDGHRLDFTHDVLGREVRRAFGDTVALTSARDSVGRLVRQDLTTESDRKRARTYTYRPDSHLTSVTEEVTGLGEHMELDPAGRPLTVTADDWTESYAYDRAGNQTSADSPSTAGREEHSVAAEYISPTGRNYSDGMVRYDMDPKFLEEFQGNAHRYDWKGPDGSARIEFVIPVDKLDRFNELTQKRTWIPGR